MGRKRAHASRRGGAMRKEHMLSLSYGKDSIACLGAIEHLGWPLDRIVTADVWATDTIPADLPPMVEFKAKADEIIKERWGITVEHFKSRYTYNDCFYTVFGASKTLTKSKRAGKIYGWPFRRGPWCNSRLKQPVFRKFPKNCIQYIGIAADETSRIERHIGQPKIKLPLVEIGWEEDYCGLWSKYSGLLSPIYTTATRGGCWFCHNQSIGQLRLLRNKYPCLWSMMLKWDRDSPVVFKEDGHTVHDYDRRFQLEDDGMIYPDDKVFRWDMLGKELNYRWF